MTALVLHDVLIVREGRHRLRWGRRGNGWILDGVWPDERELALVNRRLDRRLPLLVVFDYESPAVVAMREEVCPVPARATVRADGDGDMLEVEVTPLDWLPSSLQARGEAFAAHAAEIRRV